MEELVSNLHMHTTYSDGHSVHSGLAQAAWKTGLDVILVTDHNVYVSGLDGYFLKDNHRLLVLIGEEIHDQARDPQKNHMLVFGTNRELATFSADPQRLINQVGIAGGLSFLAHPNEVDLPLFHEPDISWVNWDVEGFTGLELWNWFSEFKTVIHSRMHAIFYAFFPQLISTGPDARTLKKWDELTLSGKRIVVVGGSDAHGIPMTMGPFKRTIFPYEVHYQSVNTHLLTPSGLTGDLALDRKMVYDALRDGHVFVGYDIPHPTRGFRFYAHGNSGTVWMGDEIAIEDGVTFQIRLPLRTECRLLRNGIPIKTWQKSENITHIITTPGVYRVECTIQYMGKKRGWIFSNPIYVKPNQT